MNNRYLIVCLVCILCSHIHVAQQPKKPSSSEIYESIKQLNFLGSVLYVAAHPDDENTKLISYFSNEIKARTAYLSLTRGDGGQNLIGPEIRELLGVIRTQELLAARRIDGGEQLFTRANDFGYSKHPTETLTIWDETQVLSDVVWAIRSFKPDIIINRFNHRTPGSTHGHHTASAILSIEAFTKAANKNAFSNQLQYTEVWQPKRLFFNTSWWFYGSQENFEKADKTNMLELNVGQYFPSLGLSNPEIAALSRSQHKSQGFGSTGTRGNQTEYLELIKGDLPTDKSSVFDGINTTWSRLEGGKPIGQILEAVEANFNFKQPEANIPQLLEAYKLLNALPNSYWKAIKLKALKTIIANCAGLYLEAVADSPEATKNAIVPLQIEAINRSSVPIKLNSLVLSDTREISVNKNLKNNEPVQIDTDFVVPDSLEYSSPYWLKENGSLGMYKVNNQRLIGNPEAPKQTAVRFNVNIQGVPLNYKKPIVYKTNDPVKGEVYSSFDIVPKVSIALAEDVIIFNDNTPKTISVTVKAYKDSIQGKLQLKPMEGWEISPKEHSVNLTLKGASTQFNFTITPPLKEDEAMLVPELSIGNQKFTKRLAEITYDHIPTQRVLLPNESKLVRLNIKKRGQQIGYIKGAGDVVPESLQQIGYKVNLLDIENLNKTSIAHLDAIVVGIRAYNTLDNLQYKQPILFDYVKNGGNLIVQYNTSHNLKVNNIAPYSLELSRDRVTDEHTEVRFLAPNHPVLNTPNTITNSDFEGWTQERGLYFPDKWADEFIPILSMNDINESPKNGSLLIAKYGKGYYVYTGLSFFREFPAGVPGAFKLFANMLSLGEN